MSPDYQLGITELSAAGRPRFRFPFRGSQVALSHDGEHLAADDFSQLVLWDLRHDEVHARWDSRVDVSPMPYAGWGGNIAFSPDGKFVALGTGFRGHNIAKRSDLRVWEISSQREVGDGPLSKGHSVFSGVCFSRNGKSLYAVQHDGTLNRWNTSNWSLQESLRVPLEEVYTVAVSPDGNTVAVGGIGIALWDTPSQRIRQIDRSTSAYDLAFTSDGKTLAATGYDKEIAFVDVESCIQLASLLGHAGIVTGCDFSPDDETLASIDYSGNLRLWKAMSLSEIDQQQRTLRLMFGQGRLLHESGDYAGGREGTFGMHYRSIKNCFRPITRAIRQDAGSSTL